MANKKIKVFAVKPKINKALTWSLAGYLVLQALVELGDFIGLAHVSSGPIIYGISRITQSGVGHVLLLVATSGLLIFIWEWVRRSLKKANFLLWYVVLALLALMVCDVLLSLNPESTSLLHQIQSKSRFESFAVSFKNVSAGVQSILQLILSIGFMVKFRGRISAFGWANVACMLASGVGMGYLYTYLYNSMTGAMPIGLAFAFVVFRYLVGVIPVVFLRRSMTYSHVSDANDGEDIQ